MSTKSAIAATCAGDAVQFAQSTERPGDDARDMIDETAQPSTERFHQAESAPGEQPPQGISPVWITLASILILELVGMAWFYRVCTRPPNPKDVPPSPASVSVPAR